MPFRNLKTRMEARYQYWVIFSLLILAVIAVATRYYLATGEGVPANDRVYLLSYDVSFEAIDKKSFIRVSLPRDTDHAIVIAQKISNPGLRITRSKAPQGTSRDLLVYATSPGKKNLRAEFTIQVSPLVQRTIKPSTLTTEDREKYLISTDDIDTESEEVVAVLNSLNLAQDDTDALLQKIFDYTNQKITSDNNVDYDDATTVLRAQKGDNLGRTHAMIALCRAAKIPARIVTGFILKESVNVGETYWLEVHDGKTWIPFDPDYGYARELPVDYIPAHRNSSSILTASDITTTSINFDINEQFLRVGKLAGKDKRTIDILDLTRLNLDARNTLAILLLLPLGALFTTFCSNIINIRTYGTFTPTLLALAARYADLVTTIVIFCIVAITGLLGQSYMPDKMSRIPRLTIVMTVVAMSMTLGVSFMDFYSFSPEGHVILLPIIILTTLVDRLYKTLDEEGLRIALTRLAWTGFVGIGCYLILLQDKLGHWILAYPEIHLITIAMVILLANYKYKKLSEFAYFSWLAEPKKAKTVTKTKSNQE